MQMSKQAPIIFYDGLCGLCDRSVQFVLKHDKKAQFLFATLQSDFAKDKLGKHFTMNSFVLWHNQKAYYRSTAVLRMLWLLGGWWRFFMVFIIVPGFIRNGIYNFIAHNRYKWFGKFDVCKIPTEQQKNRFIL